LIEKAMLGSVMKLRFPRWKKTERITVETDQILVIRRQKVIRTWCDGCQCHTDFIPVEQVNYALGAGLKVGKPGDGIHFGKALDGSTVVCAQSLARKL
jgi:hypothetical protein